MNLFLWQLVIVFLPGIIFVGIFRHLTIGPERSQFVLISQVLVFGILSYIALDTLIGLYNWVFTPDHKFALYNIEIWQMLLNINNEEIQSYDGLLADVFWACTLTIPLSSIASLLYQEKFLLSIAKIVGVSNKFGDDDTWNYYLNAKEIDWVVVRDYKQQIAFFGRLVFFSGPEKKREIVLKDVSVNREATDENEAEKLYEVPSIYLELESGNFSIESIEAEDVNSENKLAFFIRILKVIFLIELFYNIFLKKKK